MVLKIIGIISLIVLVLLALSSSYISGIIRGFTIMSNPNEETTKFEKNLIKKVFKKNLNSPFYENLFIKNELREVKKEIEKKNSKIKSKKNVKKSKK
tara:strand:+ start:27892 stop:28182 length:291 start_codon:yes stop_codon:yes gene_type:complete